MKIVELPVRQNRGPVPVSASAWLRWRRSLEGFRTALGVRNMTVHISEAEWLDRFRAANDPAFAVLDSLERVD